jgi:hypothetical protein
LLNNHPQIKSTTSEWIIYLSTQQKHQDYTRLYFIMLNKTPRLH